MQNKKGVLLNLSDKGARQKRRALFSSHSNRKIGRQGNRGALYRFSFVFRTKVGFLPAGHPGEARPAEAASAVFVALLLVFLLVPERAQPHARAGAQRCLEPRDGPIVGVHALRVDPEGREAGGAALARECVAGLESVASF